MEVWNMFSSKEEKFNISEVLSVIPNSFRDLLQMLKQVQHDTGTKNILVLTILLIVISYWLLVAAPALALSKNDEIKIAFQDILDRNPTVEELAKDSSQYRGPVSLKKQLNVWPERNQAIQNIYQRALKREPRADELEFLKKVIALNNLIRKQLFESAERELAVKDLYLGLLGRLPEATALDFYVKTRSPFQKIKEVLSGSAERKLAIEKKFSQRLGRLPTDKESDFFSLTQKYLDYIGQNTQPVAKAGDDQVVFSGFEEIRLDGRASYDLEKDGLTYVWILISSPKNLPVTLKDRSSSQPIFVAPANPLYPEYAQEGNYVWQLQVSDGQADSAPDEVTVTVKLNTQLEQTMLDLINNLRLAEGESGTSLLNFNETLIWTAREYSQYMLKNDWFNHVNKEGKNPGDRIKATGYDYRSVGENIGVVSSNMELTLSEARVKMIYDGFRDSPSHYANMVSNKFTDLGIGFYVGVTETDSKEKYRIYATQHFGRLRE